MKKYLTNLFIHLQKQIYYILDHEDDHAYSECFQDIIRIITTALDQIEELYYKYFLLPKLQKLQKQHINIT